MAKTIEEMAVRDTAVIVGEPHDYYIMGANAALEEIEKVIKADRILGHPFPSLEMRYNQIISVIEQLKK